MVSKGFNVYRIHPIVHPSCILCPHKTTMAQYEIGKTYPVDGKPMRYSGNAAGFLEFKSDTQTFWYLPEDLEATPVTPTVPLATLATPDVPDVTREVSELPPEARKPRNTKAKAKES